MIQEASSMTTTQSSNMKCFFVFAKNVSNNMIILLVVLKNPLIFVRKCLIILMRKANKISLPLKCRRLKKYIHEHFR